MKQLGVWLFGKPQWVQQLAPDQMWDCHRQWKSWLRVPSSLPYQWNRLSPFANTAGWRIDLLAGAGCSWDLPGLMTHLTSRMDFSSCPIMKQLSAVWVWKFLVGRICQEFSVSFVLFILCPQGFSTDVVSYSSKIELEWCHLVRRKKGGSEIGSKRQVLLFGNFYIISGRLFPISEI